MNQEKQSNVQSNVQSSRPTSPSIAQQSHDESLRRSANQEFLRSLSQLEQTLLTDAVPADLAVPPELSSPEITIPETEACFANDTEVQTPCPAVLHHLDVKDEDFTFTDGADLEQFIEEQGIPLDAPIANYIRATFAESTGAESTEDSGSKDSGSKPVSTTVSEIADVAPRTK